MRSRSRTGHTWLGLVTVTCAWGVHLVVPPSALAVTCTFDPATHVATVSRAGTSGGTLFISRNPAGDLIVAGSPCGTVTTVDKVNIDMAGPAGQESLGFAFNDGPLGPGFTNEDGDSDEIEFEVTNAADIFQLAVLGTDATAETFTAGSRLLRPEFILVQTLNLNGHVDGSVKDEDVTIHGLPDHIALIGRGGNDQLLANGTGTIFSNPTHADVSLSDGPGADTIVGGFGDDTQTAEATPDPGDSFAGGTGFDTLDMSARSGNTTISLNDLADDGDSCPGPACEADNIAADVEGVTTGDGNDHLVGAAGNQKLRGGGGTNILEGGPGNDLLSGGTGPDEFHGGPGVDSVSYNSHLSGVIVTVDGLADDGGPSEQDNVMPDVEILYGSFDDDRLTGSAAPNKLFGGPGDDVLSGLGGDDWLDGGGTEFGPVFGGQDGSDDFSGGSGIDTVTEAAHTGDQSLSIDGLANDLVLDDPSQGVDDIGPDVENVIGGPGSDTIRGSGQRNILTGGLGNDRLIGSGDNDVLIPNSGVDDLFGGPGADTASYATSGFPVTVHLGQGTATGQGTDELSDIERATGSAFDDHLTGSAEANTLVGGAGDDVLHGLAGNDGLYGQAGDDTLDGGPGSDLCNHGSGFGSLTSCER